MSTVSDVPALMEAGIFVGRMDHVLATHLEPVDSQLRQRTHEIYEEYALLTESLGPHSDSETFSLDAVMEAIEVRDGAALQMAVGNLQKRTLAIRGRLDGAEVPLGLGGTHRTLERGVRLRLEGLRAVSIAAGTWNESLLNAGLTRYRGGNDCFRRACSMATKPVAAPAQTSPAIAQSYQRIRTESVGAAVAASAGGAMWMGTGRPLAGLGVTLVIMVLGHMKA